MSNRHVLKMPDWSAAMFLLALALSLVFAHAVSAAGRIPPLWRAGACIYQAELVVVAEGTITPPGGLNVPGIFKKDGEARTHRYVINEVVAGNAKAGDEIVLIQPPGGDMHSYAEILHGESLLLLRRVEPDTAQRLREAVPPWSRELPEELWTFVDETHQWMSWMQLNSIPVIGGDVDDRPRGILLAQLQQHANVEPTRRAVIDYFRELTELREITLVRGTEPAERQLDRFQREVVEAAIIEHREKLSEENEPGP